MADDNSGIILLGIGAIGAWWLYENGYFAQWFGSGFAPAAAKPTNPTTSPATTTSNPITTALTTSNPVSPAVPATPVASPVTTTPAAPIVPAPASVFLVSAPVTGPNNSLQAQVSINGAVSTLNVIPSSSTVWNTAGQNITASLQSQGVNIASLISQMQAGYTAAQPVQNTTPASPSGAGASLTPNNAATTVYTPALASAISNPNFGAAVDSLIANGQIPKFAGNSVVAYMFNVNPAGSPFGDSVPQPAIGATTTGGYSGSTPAPVYVTYQYDGTNWNLVAVTPETSSGISGIGNRVPLGAIHGGLGRSPFNWRVSQRMIG
jgi:hypothetical protein